MLVLDLSVSEELETGARAVVIVTTAPSEVDVVKINVELCAFGAFATGLVSEELEVDEVLEVEVDEVDVLLLLELDGIVELAVVDELLELEVDEEDVDEEDEVVDVEEVDELLELLEEELEVDAGLEEALDDGDDEVLEND